MIKNIIFDLGNVIINYNQDNIINHFTDKPEEKEYIMEKIFKSPEWMKIDLGEISLDEAATLVNERENYKYKDLTNDFWINWFKTQPINEDTVNLARRLKEKGYNLFVLSNMGDACYEYFSTQDFFKLCNGIVISAKEHVKKPDERIFNTLLGRYNLIAEECLFIDDDDTNRSYETANRLGIQGRRVIPNNVEDIKKLLKEFSVE